MLYFDNLSPDTTDAYLADGLTEEIIARLGQLDRFTVKSRNAVRRYRGAAAADPAALGRALGVARLVSGSVRRGGNRLRVTVELIGASSGDRVWGEQFDRTDADLLDIQAEIAAAVARAVVGRLAPADQANLARRPTSNPEAYDRFLRGNYYLRERTPRALLRAIAEYTEAARLDATYAKALGRIAYGHSIFLNRGWGYPGLAPESLLARGLALAERAVRSDSMEADAWLARGSLLLFVDPYSPRGAKDALRRATLLDPKNAEALARYGVFLRTLGDTAGGTRSLRQALAVDPEQPIVMTMQADMAFIERRYEEARRWTDSALAVDAGFHDAYARRAMFRLYLGDMAGARADAETALRLAAGDDMVEEVVLAQLAARSGDSASARAIVARLLSAAPSGSLFNTFYGRHVAGALVALGEPARAIELLERVRPRGAQLWYFLHSPEFDAIREEPRFQRLVEETRPPGAPR